jgi:hypothetical protein
LNDDALQFHREVRWYAIPWVQDLLLQLQKCLPFKWEGSCDHVVQGDTQAIVFVVQEEFGGMD